MPVICLCFGVGDQESRLWHGSSRHVALPPSGVTTVVNLLWSIAAVAARCLDRLQFLKIEFNDDLQLLCESLPFHAGRQVVE
jgi:hypothetical protein